MGELMADMTGLQTTTPILQRLPARRLRPRAIAGGSRLYCRSRLRATMMEVLLREPYASIT